MRQILFRGKTIDSGRWIKGYLVQGQWYYDDSPMTVIIPTDITFYPRCEISGYEDVDPETVGQWTGLVDKNDKKIFEGDIVECWGRRVSVIYDIDYAEFEFDDIIELSLCVDYKECEVIGNKWDNPELLEE